MAEWQVLLTEVTRRDDVLEITQHVVVPYPVKRLSLALSLCLLHARNPLGTCVFCNDQAED